ncbi:MAG: cell division protein ZapA [Acidobacteriota bacterium]
MDNSSQLVQVEIFGQTYSLRGGAGDSAYLQDLAGYLDRKMRDISDHTGTADTMKLAILAALNVVDELFQLKSGSEGSAVDWSGKAEEFVEMLDRCLKEAER